MRNSGLDILPPLCSPSFHPGKEDLLVCISHRYSLTSPVWTVFRLSRQQLDLRADCSYNCSAHNLPYVNHDNRISKTLLFIIAQTSQDFYTFLVLSLEQGKYKCSLGCTTWLDRIFGSDRRSNSILSSARIIQWNTLLCKIVFLAWPHTVQEWPMRIQLHKKVEVFLFGKSKKQKIECTYFKTSSLIWYLVHITLSVSPKQQKNTLCQKKEAKRYAH